MKAGDWMWTMAFIGILLLMIGGILWCGQRIPLDDEGPAIAFWGGLAIFLIFGLAGKMYDRGAKDTETKTEDED